MASQLAATSPVAAAEVSAAGRVIRLLVRRRVPISVGLFSSLVLLDLLIIHSRPRDLLQLADPRVAAAVAMVLGGLVVRSWAAGTLRKERELATTGPYAWIRNPLYFGSFLMMVGFGMLIHDPITLWIVAGPVAWLYWQAVKSEERRMAQLFPAEWPRYRSAVPRFVPWRIAPLSVADWSLAQWLRNQEFQAWLGSAVALAGIKAWQMWM
jgi:protein-S-isoprenylcysteine O-methyltransferase Ste14